MGNLRYNYNFLMLVTSIAPVKSDVKILILRKLILIVTRERHNQRGKEIVEEKFLQFAEVFREKSCNP